MTFYLKSSVTRKTVFRISDKSVLKQCSDTQVCANSTDPERSSSLFAIPVASFLRYHTMVLLC